MFNPDGSLDKRTQRILREQTIPPRYGRSPGMDALPRITIINKYGLEVEAENLMLDETTNMLSFSWTKPS